MTRAKEKEHLLFEGATFGKWTILRPRYPTNAYSTCQCVCGTIKSIQNSNLYNGRSTQCMACARVAKQRSRRKILYKGEEVFYREICDQLGIQHTTPYTRAKDKCLSLQEAFDWFVLQKEKEQSNDQSNDQKTHKENRFQKATAVTKDGKTVATRVPIKGARGRDV
jgi:hypothetical protein